MMDRDTGLHDYQDASVALVRAVLRNDGEAADAILSGSDPRDLAFAAVGQVAHLAQRLASVEHTSVDAQLARLLKDGR